MRAIILTATVGLFASVWPVTASLAQSPATQPARPAASAEMATEKADKLIATGLAFLRSQQAADGSWGDARTPPGISALALRSFAKAGITPAKDADVRRGYERLLAYQTEAGGIYKDLLANYNTAIAISALTAADEPAYKERIDRAVAYLKGLQWTPETRPEYAGKADEKTAEANLGKQVVTGEADPFHGGWGYGGRSRGAGRPDLSNAQMAIEALHDAGVDKDDPAMRRAVAFLSRVQNASETNDQPWAGDDGGFVYGPADNRSGESLAGEYVDAGGKRLLRSYGSMTYAGLKSMIYAGLTKDDPRVKAAHEWVRNNWTLDENPGMKFSGPDAAQSGLYYYYHTLARALAAYGEPTVTPADGAAIDWRVALIDKLATLQRPDGSWNGSARWMENNPVLVTSYVVQALQEARGDLNKAEQ